MACECGQRISGIVEDGTNLMKPVISVIIPTHNPGQDLESCMGALFTSDFSGFECILVDDASTDDITGVVKKYPASLIRLPANRGPAYARNRGVKASTGDFLVFLDDDVMIRKDTLNMIACFFKNNPHVDAIFGSYDDKPAHPDFISQYKNLFPHFTHQNSRNKASTFWAGCGAIKRDVFLKAGGFRESFSRPSVEDIELGMRLVKNGYHIELVKYLQVKHLKKWSFFTLLESDIFHRGIPWTALMLRYRMARNDLNTRWNAGFSSLLILSSAIMVFSGTFRAFWVGVFLLVGFLLLNIRFYRFFYSKKGWLFTLLVFPMHILYYIYGSFCLIAGLCFYPFSRIRKI